MIQLIDTKIAGCRAEQLLPVTGATDVVVHRADERYRFLHDNAVVWHKGILWAAWYNCPQGEIAGESCIRGRRSQDGGRTWSPVEVIAADKNGEGVHYVPVVFCSSGGRLYAFVSNMTGHDLVTHLEVFVLDEVKDVWRSHGFVAEHFLANCAPVRMENGAWIMFGRASDSSEVKPAYPAAAIQDTGDLTAPWRVVRIGRQAQPPCPESTAWVEGPHLTAIVRGGPHLFESSDFGMTWEGPLKNNLPAEKSKLYAGRLSTGQRYLIWNWPDSERRSTLVIGVSRPGGERLDAVWRIRRGEAPELECSPEWSYPCAAEHKGNLYVIYSAGKMPGNSVMTVIPVSVLAV